MKILAILPFNPFYQNSASANRWLTLIEGLKDLKVDITLLITGGYNSFAEYKQLGIKGINNGIRYQYLTFLFHSNIWLRRLNRFLLSPLIMHLTTHKALKISCKNPDAICWTDSSRESFELAVKIKKKSPRIKTFLEMSEFLDIHNYNKDRLVHRIKGDKRKAFFEKKAFYAYDGIALMTKTLIKHYQSFPDPKPKFLHLPMTVDLERFNRELPVPAGFSQPYIAFVGVMNDAKDGVKILIKAFSEIHLKIPAYKLYLVGPWHYDTPGHLKLIEDLGLKNKVFWMGEYTKDKIPAILKNATLLVLPRPNSKQAQGGFPTKLGEYLATGNPVCCTRVGEIPDYLIDGESVFFAKPGSISSFAEAMLRAITNSEQAKRVGENGRKIAEKYFNKDFQAKILYDFLQNNLQTE